MKKIILILIFPVYLISCSNWNKELETKNQYIEYNKIEKQIVEQKNINTKKNIVKENINESIYVEKLPQLPWDWYIDFDCTTLNSEQLIKKCLIKKLSDTFEYRYRGTDDSNLHKLNCEKIFDTNIYFWLEKLTNKYLEDCNTEKIIDTEKYKKSQKGKNIKENISPIKYCSIKYELYNKPDKNYIIEKCEYSIALEKWCNIFKETNRVDRCIEIKENIQKYYKMKLDFDTYGQL